MNPVDDLGFKVEFGWGDDPTDAVSSVTWVDMTALEVVRSVEYTRGTTAWPSPFTPGTARVTLKNNDGEFDPLNSGSSYYNDMLPGVPVRISMTDSGATRRYLYTGYVRPQQGYVPVYPTLNRSDVVVSCVDRLQWHAEASGAGIDATSVTATLAGGVIDEALAAASSGSYDVDTTLDDGTARLNLNLTDAPWTGTLGGFIDKVVRSEGGLWFIDGSGEAIFYDRHAWVDTTALNTSQATFTDANASPSSAMFLSGSLSRSFGSRVATSSTVAAYDGTQVTETVSGSLPSGLEIDYPVSDTFLADSNEASGLAAWHATTLSTITSHPNALAVNPFTSDDTRDAVAELDLMHRVTTEVTFPGLSEQTHVGYVTGRTDTINVGAGWTCSFSLIASDGLDATDYDEWFTLNDASLGLDDGKLAY